MNFASDLDYVRGIHSLRVWERDRCQLVSLERHVELSGTYTFESLDAYNAGHPRSFVKRIGDPNIDFHNLQAALYAQDDIRVRKSLTLTTGIRYEAQSHVSDYANLGPRFRHHVGTL
jgi:outer membrane receptor for ferrienterochelin and colicin